MQASPLTANDQSVTSLSRVISMEGMAKEVFLTLMYHIQSIGLCNTPGTCLCRSGVPRGWLTHGY